MSVSPVHSDPACPDCRGEGAVRFDPRYPDLIPCGRCKARECGYCDAVLPVHEPGCIGVSLDTTPPIVAAVAAEREACAKLCDDTADEDLEYRATARELAKRIRARGGR